MSAGKITDGWTREEVEAYEGLCAVTKQACEEQGVGVEEFASALAGECRPTWRRRIWRWVAGMMRRGTPGT